MTEISARFALPFLQPGQAQKELYHNEALAMLDIALHASVQSAEQVDPPASPAPGQCWIVAAAATGAWNGRDGAIAGWTSGGWRFVEPREGMLAWSLADGVWLQRLGTTWVAGRVSTSSVWSGGVQVVGSQGSAITGPAGGPVVDVEAREAIVEVLEALRAHGLIAT